MILREIKNMYINRFTEIEYLESTGTQYIDTEVYANLDTSVDVKFCFTEIFPDNQIITSDMGNSGTNSFGLGYFINDFYKYGIVFSIDGASAIAYKGTTEIALEWFEVNASKRGLVINNGFYPSRYTPANFASNYPLFMFAYGRNGVPIIFGKSRITYLKIYNNGALIRDFIPVRVGSVGYMYDRVSGRLFGNAGTGNFVLGPDVDSRLQQIYQNKLIEGVDYETYDWLIQDENGGAYIDTKIKDLTDFSKIKVHYYVTGNPSRIFGREAINGVGGGQCLILISSDNTRTQLYCPKGYQFKNVGKDQIMNIDYDNQQATLNNETVSVTLDRIVTSHTMKVFTRYPSEAKAGVKFAEVTFTTTTNGEILHLVPCTLLHSIPRNLDAQCKERQAGECGMIDLISGKFYGNVANSGTFTVENDNNE